MSSETTKNYQALTPGGGTNPSGERLAVAAFPDSNNNNGNNDRGTGINPSLLIPSMREGDNNNSNDHTINMSPTRSFIDIQHRYDAAHMDYRIAQAWISSAPTTTTSTTSPSSKTPGPSTLGGEGEGEKTQRDNKQQPEDFEDEFTESVKEGENRNNNSSTTISNPFEGLRRTLFSYPSPGVQQHQEEGDHREVPRGEDGDAIVEQEHNKSDSLLALLPREDGLDHDYLNENMQLGVSSMPGTPPSMDLSVHRDDSDNENGELLPIRQFYGPTSPIPHSNNDGDDDDDDNSNDETSSDDDENDDPNNQDDISCSSFKAVASPRDIQEESPFQWMRNPQSWIPDEIVLDNDQRPNMEDDLLPGDVDPNQNHNKDDSNKNMSFFRPPTLGAPTPPRPVPIVRDDRQLTPQSWHTPISMLPRSIGLRNTSGGSKSRRSIARGGGGGGSVPLSPGSRRSGKSEMYYHSYETDAASSLKPVPPFVVVHSRGSAVVKVTPKRTILLPTTTKQKQNRVKTMTASAIDPFIPEENSNNNISGEANCGCDGETKTKTKVWCQNWGRPVTIALASAAFVLAIVTVVTSLVASQQRNKKQEQQQQQLRPQIPEPIDTIRPISLQTPTESPAVFPPTNFSDLVLDTNNDNTTGDLDVLWDEVVQRPYEESQNPAMTRPTPPLRTFPPSISPQYAEIIIPTSAPTMLPDNFPDFVPTNLPTRTQQPSSAKGVDYDSETPPQIPWNNYVIGLLSVKSPDTFPSFDDPTSPQFLALQWISVDSSIAYTMDASLQRFALATVYFALGGPTTWFEDDSWLSTVVHVCEWKGVACDNSNTAVLSLDLPENGLSGTLPVELKLLKYLQTLSFPRNSIGGLLPPDYSILYELVELNLSSNLLTGSLPEEYGGNGSFELLEILDVSQNNLQGSLPSELADLPSLEIISVCSNAMTGTIPSALGSLSELKSLGLGNNGFTGRLPGAICDLETSDGELPRVMVDCNIDCECCVQCCGDGDDSNKCC